MEELNLRAYAKVNLGLDVVRKREDGYHEVSMIMQTVKLFDRLHFEKQQEDTIELTTNLKFLPVDENNLVYKVVRQLKEEFQIKEGIRIHLDKHIPVAAGMAGGSSDCAAALFGMNRMFGLNLSRKELMERGVKLGADVPYCIMRGTALSEGIGEILTPLPPMPDCYIVIAKPPISVSTKYVYEHLDLPNLEHHPNISAMIEALKNHHLKGITATMENVLETVTIHEYPVIKDIKTMMLEAGAENALMSGSGPTVFGIFTDKELAVKANDTIYQSGLAKQVYTVEPYNVYKKTN
ncbi:MAG: 4-(cytidine 5'-diphospho)-2-C-methyl-D-erythritol kinase [Lachnospira sp.]|nr:4-(cytidine 5'-diphospho)-2-C-methyl-D-erythritol kinase [Lachnospira sp.]